MIPESASPDPRVEFFNAQAAGWDRHGHDGDPLDTLIREAQRLGLRPGMDVLEVGSGTGAVTAWLAEQVTGGRVKAIDFAPEMIARARAKGINAEFAVADACRDDLGCETFDVVFCFHVFPHFRDQAAAVKAVARALRPGGRLLVMHRAGSEHINAFHAGVDGPVKADHLPVGDEWTDLLDGTGLTIEALIDRDDLLLLEARKKPPVP